jgi:FtsH-binding integral membrane protein
LLGSTFLGGCFAVMFWFGLKICPSLWMFLLWTLLFGLYFSSKLYQISASRFGPSFWQNTAVTMLILLGPAVQDSANGKDVYAAFAVRMGLFVAVTAYAWAAIFALEQFRARRQAKSSPPAMVMEPG